MQLSISEGSMTRGWAAGATLVRVFWFTCALVIPLLMAAYSTGMLGWTGAFKRAQQDAPAFPNSRFLAPGGPIKLASTEQLNPLVGEDFLVVTWVMLRKLPEPGQRIILLNKVDGPDRKQTGYAIGLTNEAGSIRPIVFWRDALGQGGWQTFAEIPVVTRAWMMLGLSFREQKLLGLHGGVRIPGSGVKSLAAGELKLLGGYDVAGRGLPEPSSLIVVNPIGAGGFHGRLGLVSVLRAPDIGKDLLKTLKSFFNDPMTRPQGAVAEAVKVWTVDGR